MYVCMYVRIYMYVLVSGLKKYSDLLRDDRVGFIPGQCAQ